MKSILFFDSMLTPKIITFVYWLTLLAVLIAGLMTMFGGYGGLTIEKLFMGIFTIVGGAIGTRIWCELLIVLFKINDNLKRAADRQA